MNNVQDFSHSLTIYEHPPKLDENHRIFIIFLLKLLFGQRIVLHELYSAIETTLYKLIWYSFKLIEC